MNTTFKSFNLKKSMLDTLNSNAITIPTDIQTTCIPLLIKNTDLIVTSPTGTGKTIAFVVPIINSILKTNSFFHSLIITPTRDLALQTQHTFLKFGHAHGLRVLCLIGGEDEKQQKEALFKSPHVIIGTPGRMHFILKRIKLFNNLKYIIIDECDMLATDSYEKDVRKVLDSVNGMTIALFTATMVDRVKKFSRYLKSPVCIGNVDTKVKSNVDQKIVLCGFDYKEAYLYSILNLSNKTAIVFVSSCLSALTISLFINKMGLSSTCLYGDLCVNDRKEVVESFKKGECTVLVATDLAARGLDVPIVDLVVNYDLVKSNEYIHRVGRTARYDRKGMAISFVTQYDVEAFQRIENGIGEKMGEYYVDKNKVMDVHDKTKIVYSEAYNEVKERNGDRNNKKRRRKTKSH